MSQEQLQQAQEQINALKVRNFDLQEAIQAERNSFGQFCGVLAQLLGLDGEDAQDLQLYVNKVAELTGHGDPKVEAPTEAGE